MSISDPFWDDALWMDREPEPEPEPERDSALPADYGWTLVVCPTERRRDRIGTALREAGVLALPARRDHRAGPALLALGTRTEVVCALRCAGTTPHGLVVEPATELDDVE